MIKTYLLSFLTLWLLFPQQQYAQTLISPLGGFSQLDDCSISWSIGEPVIETVSLDNILLTQGFQQPNLEEKEADEFGLVVNTGLIQGAANENGIFTIEGLEEYPNNKVIVLNRWGNRVFEATPYLNNWQGDFNGRPLPQATYYYIIYPEADQDNFLSGNLYILK